MTIASFIEKYSLVIKTDSKPVFFSVLFPVFREYHPYPVKNKNVEITEDSTLFGARPKIKTVKQKNYEQGILVSEQNEMYAE